MRAAALVLTLLLVAAACGDDDGSPEVTTTTGPPTTGAPSTGSTTTPTGPTTSTAAASAAFRAESIVAGDQHACALVESGRAYCWGSNEFGQLGDGSGEDRLVPAPVADDVRFARLAAGRYFTCGITTVGEFLCWGSNAFGQLGDGRDGGGGDEADRAEPGPLVADPGFVDVVLGQVHACATTADGDVWCWGAGSSGQLGADRASVDSTPGPVAGAPTVRRLAPGGDTHACGIDDAEGALWCWGSDAFGQLARGEPSNAGRPEPAAVDLDRPVVAAALGARHTCAVDESGGAWCWGDNRQGQLGDGTTGSRATPGSVSGGVAFSSITAGDAHTCALAADGGLWCWGAGSDGRLGVAGAGDRVTEPQRVDGRWQAAAAGEEFTCAIDDSGGAWCWGSNRVGWLGTGTLDDSPVPVPVAPPVE